MSKATLTRFINQAIARLEQDIREEINLEEHSISISLFKVKKAIYDEVTVVTKRAGGFKYLQSNVSTEEIKRTINEYLNVNFDRLLEKMKIQAEEIKRNLAESATINIRYRSDNNFKFLIVKALVFNSSSSSITSSFNTIKQIYRDEMAITWTELSNILKKYVREGAKKQFLSVEHKFDLEHKTGLAVSDRRIAAALTNLTNSVQSHLEKQTGKIYSAKDILKFLELDSYSSYLAEFEKTYIEVYFGSATKNRQYGTLEKLAISKLKTQLLDIAKSNPKKFTRLKGSDSREDIETKKIINSFVSKTKKDRRVKVSNIDTKLNLGHYTTKNKKIKIKPNKSVTYKASAPKLKKIQLGIDKDKKSIINLSALKAQINARLSMTIIKNMGTPALENRTGRFARSAQVESIAQTAKGFPSIAYTYQKYPYQTFEPGFKQGSAQRDPRTLIDRSIREIAKDLIVGRFYTRRI